MEKMSMHRIIDLYSKGNGRGGLSTRPEYYAGRGATTSDLDSTILTNIYHGIRREIGEEAAGEMVKIVAAMPSMSATAFLVNMYSLEDNGWKAPERLTKSDMAIGPDLGDGSRELGAMAAIFSSLGRGDDRGSSETIRGPFLQQFAAKHGIKVKRYDPFGFDERTGCRW